jgi:tRNA A-37 threonylcarbamoyl transferase component Bud32
MPSDTIGRYRLLQPIAEGGMAEIYLARQEGPGGFEKTVVIKRMRPHLARDPEFMTMFMNEARVVARLSHPNIVQVYDFGELDGSYFLCMEWLVGGDLDQVLSRVHKRKQHVPPAVAAVILSAVCDALHYAHNLKDAQGQLVGLVHRDLSPNNIYVTTQGAVKVLDFGIVKMAGRGHETRAGVIKGKPYYLSPEQVRGKVLDGRSDLFALGAVLYELITGVRPFQRDEEFACMNAILEDPIPPPRTVVPTLPEKLEHVVMKALERDPDKRYANAHAMRVALDGFVASCTTSPASRQLQGFMEDLWAETPAIAPLPEPAVIVAPQAAIPELAPAPAPDPEEAVATHAMAAAAAAAQATSVKLPRPAPEDDEPTVPRSTRAAAESTDELIRQAQGKKRGWLIPVIGLAGAAAAVGVWKVFFTESPRPEPVGVAAPPPLAPVAAVVQIPALVPAPPAVPEAKPAEPVRPPVAEVAPPKHLDVPKARKPVPQVVPEARPPLLPAAAVGHLDVNCIPWCQVWIDDATSPRNSPVLGLDLAEGSHKVKVVQPESGVQQVRDVRIQADQTAKAIIRF